MPRSVDYKWEYISGTPICDNEKLGDVPTSTKEIWIRNSLTINLDLPGDKTVLTICMNPSKANAEKSDGTINDIVDYIYHETKRVDTFIPQVGSITMVNLFPFYEPNSDCLQGVLDLATQHEGIDYEQILARNQECIREIIVGQNPTYIILGWGKVPSGMTVTTHREQRNLVFNHLREANRQQDFFVFKKNKASSILTSCKQPRHPSRSSIVGLSNAEILRNNVLRAVE